MDDPDVIFIGRRERVNTTNDVSPANYFAQETQRRSPQNIQANNYHDNNNNNFDQAAGASTFDDFHNAHVFNGAAGIVNTDMHENILQGNNFQQGTEDTGLFPWASEFYRDPYRMDAYTNGVVAHSPAESTVTRYDIGVEMGMTAAVSSFTVASTSNQPGFPFQVAVSSTVQPEKPPLNAYREPEPVCTRLNAYTEPVQTRLNAYREPDPVRTRLNAYRAPEPVRTRLNAYREPAYHAYRELVSKQKNAAGPSTDIQPAFLNPVPYYSGAVLPGGQPRKYVHTEPIEQIPMRRNPSRNAKILPHTTTRPERDKLPKISAQPTAKTKAKSQEGGRRKVPKIGDVAIDPVLPPPQPPPLQQPPLLQPPPPQPSTEEESDYQRLLRLQATALVASTEDALCPVCREWVPAGAGAVLKDCLHSFCRTCLQKAVLNSQTAEIRCPFANEEYSCESHLQDCEIKCLVPPEDYERHLAKSVFQARCQATNAFFCMTPGCAGWCIVESLTREFVCPVCGRRNCVPCATIHEGTDCGDHLIDPRGEEGACAADGVESGCASQTQGYHSLLELNDLGLVTNKEKFDCPICFCDIEIGEGVILKDCLHNYCRECLAGTIRHSETVLVKCPFVNDQYACDSFLQEREIKYLVSEEEFERHLARGLAQVEHQSKNSFHCKTPDCPGWCLFEEDANQFFCQVCSHMNCLACGAIHEGQNCKQFQELLEFNTDTNKDVRKTRKFLEKQVQKNLAMKCPTCQIIVMKRDGCDWLICAMCRTQICWATKGPRWGPGGKGDTSGGCKCDFKNGKPCHPKCQNCH